MDVVSVDTIVMRFLVVHVIGDVCCSNRAHAFSSAGGACVERARAVRTSSSHIIWRARATATTERRSRAG